MSAEISSLRSIPLAALIFSSTPAQIERRAHLDKEKLAELAESIKSHGLADLRRLLWELLILDEFAMSMYNATQKLTNVAKSLKINVDAIKKQVTADLKEQAANEKDAPVWAPRKAARKRK